jgi:hypothetical protein
MQVSIFLILYKILENHMFAEKIQILTILNYVHTISQRDNDATFYTV